MSTSNVFEITMHGELFEQECENVFFYRGVSGSDPTFAEVADAFYDQIWSLVQLMVSTDYTLNTIEVRNILGSASPHIQPIVEAGLNGAGDTFGSMAAFGFTLGVATSDTRPGSKRFAGVDEAVVTDGVVTDAGTITGLNDISDALNDVLVDVATGLVTLGVPVIVKRILDSGVYRLPTSLGELVTNLVTSAVAHLIVTTQNSRKVGTGS